LKIQRFKYQQTFFCFYKGKNTNFLEKLHIFSHICKMFEKVKRFLKAFSSFKIKHWIRIHIQSELVFKTLDPDLHELDVDPNPA